MLRDRAKQIQIGSALNAAMENAWILAFFQVSMAKEDVAAPESVFHTVSNNARDSGIPFVGATQGVAFSLKATTLGGRFAGLRVRSVERDDHHPGDGMTGVAHGDNSPSS